MARSVLIQTVIKPRLHPAVVGPVTPPLELMLTASRVVTGVPFHRVANRLRAGE